MRGALVAVLLVACAPPHTTFPPLPPNLTPEQRVQAFNGHVAAKEHWVSQDGQVVEHSVIMQNGGEVYYPEDLVPLVGEDSATAEHARKAVRARSSRNHWQLAGGLLILGGSIFVMRSFDDPGGASNLAIAAVLTGVVAYGVGVYYRFKATSETHAAYGAYDDDLAKRLDVCVAALQVVPCEAVPQPGQPAPPTPQGSGGYYPGQPVEKH